MFTAANTEGFTAADLELMNTAAAALIAQGVEESNAADIVNNNWMPEGNTVESLTAR